jgi:hypothetical protein
MISARTVGVIKVRLVCDMFVTDALRSVWLMFFLLCSILFFGGGRLRSQCPNTGQSRVIKPNEGSGYFFYSFRGDSSVRYFLDGKTFSMNKKDDPGKTFLFIDNMVYEPLLIERAQLENYTKSAKAIDILRAQAKYEQAYFKKLDPSMLITDYGPAGGKNPDGSEDRLFYLWKKESASGKQAATQYLCSTLIKDGVFVMSFMTTDASVSEGDMMRKIQSYTSHFDQLSSSQCAQVLAMPSAP